jgi:peroxiredoxin
MLELALLVARLLLAAVFLLAGIAKLSDPQGTIRGLHDFGLPWRLAQALSLVLSLGEIVVAVALVPLASAWYGACGALGLLLIFVVAIGINLARGRKPDCHCSGQLHSAPVGWRTLARNGVLGVLAGWLVLRGPLQVGPSLWQHLSAAGDDERRLFVVAGCVMCFLFFRAMRQRPRPESEGAAEDWFEWDSESDDEQPQPTPEPVRERAAPTPAAPRPTVPRPMVPADGLPTGTPAPEFALPCLTGEVRPLQSLREQGKTICLVFSSPYCESCAALVPYVRRWMLEYRESLNMFIISRGTAKDALAKMKDIEVSRVLLQKDFEVSEMYGCTATPAAVLIGSDGMVRSQLVVGRDEIRKLIASAVKLSSPSFLT